MALKPVLNASSVFFDFMFLIFFISGALDSFFVETIPEKATSYISEPVSLSLTISSVLIPALSLSGSLLFLLP
jgi:hypothetical protein